MNIAWQAFTPWSALAGGALIGLAASLLLGTPALSAIGAIGAALTLGVRGGGVLISLLVLPLYVPVLIFGVAAVEGFVMGLSGTGPLLILGAMLLAALGLTPFATAAALRLALEQHGTGRGARPPEHGLRAFDHGQAVVGFRRNIGRGRVHAVGAGAQHQAAIGEDIQARAEHAAESHIAIGPCAAVHRTEANNALQVVCAIACRNRLNRLFRISTDNQPTGIISLLSSGDNRCQTGNRPVGLIIFSISKCRT